MGWSSCARFEYANDFPKEFNSNLKEMHSDLFGSSLDTQIFKIEVPQDWHKGRLEEYFMKVEQSKAFDFRIEVEF